MVEGCEEWMAWTGNGRRQTEPWARQSFGEDVALRVAYFGPSRAPLSNGTNGAKLLESAGIAAHRGGTCLDKGYDNPSGRGAAAGHGYREHIRRIGEEKLDASGDKRYPARRWVVERTLAWLSKCRAVLVRYDKKAANYLGVLQLACALLWFRRQWRLAILR